jgi:heme-degrading monooxygenase HmoA
MFIHTVMFEVKPNQVLKYRNDSKMWAGFAKKNRGFVAYFTMRRIGHRDQFASVYEWKSKQDHDRFMKKYHDWLVAKSKAKVKVHHYFNLKTIDRLR